MAREGDRMTSPRETARQIAERKCYSCDGTGVVEVKCGAYWTSPEGRVDIRQTWDGYSDGNAVLPLLDALEAAERDRDAWRVGAEHRRAQVNQDVLDIASLTADLAQARQEIAHINAIVLPHARAQANADGFQEGWHGALARVRDGDTDPELTALVPNPLAAAEQARDEALKEIADAMVVLAPNMPESGLVDACRQVKQVAISEADNSEKAEQQLAGALQGIKTIEERAARTALLEAAEEIRKWTADYVPSKAVAEWLTTRAGGPRT